jgi:hypothetical protein
MEQSPGNAESPEVDHSFLVRNLVGLGLYGKELRDELLLAANETEGMSPGEQYAHLMSLADYSRRLTGWDMSNDQACMIKTGAETKILKKVLKIPGIAEDSDKYFDVHTRLLSSLGRDISDLQNTNRNALPLQYLRTTVYEDRIKTARILKRYMSQHPSFYNRLIEAQVNDILRPAFKFITTVYVSPEYL